MTSDDVMGDCFNYDLTLIPLGAYVLSIFIQACSNARRLGGSLGARVIPLIENWSML